MKHRGRARVFRLARIAFAAATVLWLAVVAGSYFHALHRVQAAISEAPKRLGIEAQQVGFTFSKTEGVRTLYTMRAANSPQYKTGQKAELRDVNIIICGKQGNRCDQIYGPSFEYDPLAGTVSTQGEAHIDLGSDRSAAAQPDQAPPQELKNAIHLKTSGLVFDQKTGLAETREWIEFVTPQIHGTARGAHYNPRDSTVMVADIHIFTQRAAGRTPAPRETAIAEITARRAVIGNQPLAVTLEDVRGKNANETFSADRVRLLFHSDYTMDRAIASGNVQRHRAGPRPADFHAGQVELAMAPNHAARTAVVFGNSVIGSASDAGTPGPLTGDWVGTATSAGPSGNGTYQASAHIVETSTSVSVTMVFTKPSGATTTLSATAQINGSTLTFANGKVTVNGTISSDGLQISGNGTNSNGGTFSGSVTVQQAHMTGNLSDSSGNTGTLSLDQVLVIRSVSPGIATAGGAAFSLTVAGSGFVASSVVNWNGSSRPTTFVSGTQLTAAIPATDIAVGGTNTVTVFTPAPGGGTSAGVNIFVTASATTFPLSQLRYWPHIVTAGTFVTKMTIVNLTNAQNSVVVYTLSQAGATLTTTSYSLGPAATVRFQTPESGRFGPQTIQWAIVNSSAAVGINLFFEVVQDGSTGFVVNTVGFNDAPPLTDFTLPVEFQPTPPGFPIGRTIGIAIANTTNTAGTITFKLIDQNGNLIATAVRPLGPFAQTALDFQISVPEFGAVLPAANFIGSVTVSSTVPISAVGLEDDLGPFSAIPPIPGRAK
jgi:hypothetical protein